MTEENDVLLAQRITKVLSLDGGKDLIDWVKRRMELLTDRALVLESDIQLGEVKTDKAKKTHITVININKDYSKHEVMVWRMFLKKISEWEITAKGE